MDLGKHLSKSDAIGLLELVSKGLECRSEDDYKDLVLELKDLIDFEWTAGGYVEVGDVLVTNEFSEYVVNVNYPLELLEWYYDNDYNTQDPVLVEFFKTFELQNWQDVTRRCLDGKKDIVTRQFEDFRMKDGFAYGVRDFNLTHATCIFFSGEQVENNERTRTIIKFIVPHFSELLKRLVVAKRAKTKYPLTPREREILKWLREGKSSWDISKILGRSESVINFHVKNIVRKLDAMNRTHAVAIALEHGLVEL